MIAIEKAVGCTHISPKNGRGMLFYEGVTYTESLVWVRRQREQGKCGQEHFLWFPWERVVQQSQQADPWLKWTIAVSSGHRSYSPRCLVSGAGVSRAGGRWPWVWEPQLTMGMVSWLNGFAGKLSTISRNWLDLGEADLPGSARPPALKIYG